MFRNYNCSQLTFQKLGKKVILNGWVRGIINKGGVLFFSLHDASGKIQVITKEKKIIKVFQKEVNSEDLLSIWGTVQQKRPKKNTELSQQQKEIEINLEKYQIINQTKPLPFEIKDEANINEDNRFRYRYLDLRRNVSKGPLIIRHHFLHQIRSYLYKQGFIEVETPILAQNSPEGAKCFIVPSPLGKQRYYTLPQSPQIFKQLLMMSGFAKHYQIDKSFRNEDARSNRQIEFSQLDLEMSFTSTKKIMNLVEKFLKFILRKTFNHQLKIPFSVLTYQQAMEKYGTDKPDLRQNPKNEKELNFLWIIDWPLFEYNQETKKYEAFRHPFTVPQKKYVKPLLDGKIKPEKVICEAFDLICNGEEVLSGSLRIYQRELQEKIFAILGYSEQKQEKYFGYFLQALEFAAPPHGGFGLGIDRLLAIILNLKNLKEVIAFPKNIDGSCSLTGTPNYIDEKL
ncbi:amino acid--tRNA ligase-related protein [endosymbiont GvMRE of Glomus versiforme]|uniref:amino acid--tRNA ligase-related protein n=1 Tax=endosymbiont GvMRE of Glomus versiforme TaxID=2039283 RepID=UPI000EC0E92A|nr:amino acid--tRNA ligase-related protein [endosymbiont GvMRE of Glomus versiforme]RHZ36925.1 Aspartate--tRNA(Asp/Asn) ligase [endosymbiont GvMRE of Glomus versiforme]